MYLFILSLPNALLKCDIYANTFIREFEICQHGGGNNWQGTGPILHSSFQKKKKAGTGLSLKIIMKAKRQL